MNQQITSLKKVKSQSALFQTCNTGLLDTKQSWLDYLLCKALPADAADGCSFFLRRNHFDVIITEDYRTAIVFGLLTRLFGCRAKHLVKELYLAEDTLTNRRKRSLFRYALKAADCVILNATSERQAYADFLHLPLERFVFLPWPSNLPPQAAAPDRGYIFAAGRSMRDWKTLFECAATLPVPFTIVASRADVAALAPPPNVTVRCDVGREEYLALLAGAHIVLLPLTKTLRSTGQAVALEAMSMRKPLLAADSPGILDYIADEENGLLYCAGSSVSLSRQLNRLLASAEMRARLAAAGADRVRTVFNKESYLASLTALMKRLVYGPLLPSAAEQDTLVEAR